MNASGFTASSSLTPSIGSVYCGTATRLINYTYTPGTTVTVSVSATTTETPGNFIRYWVAYDTAITYHEIIGGSFSFVPIDITATSQSITFKIQMYSQTTLAALVLEDISITISESITPGSLAVKVIKDFDDVTNLIGEAFTIDESYYDIDIPNAYLAPDTYKEVLREITEAVGGRAYQRRDGTLVLEALRNVGTPVKTYTDSNTFSRQTPITPEALYNRVTVKVNTLVHATTPEQAAIVPIDIADGEVQSNTVFFSVDPTDTITYSGLPSGVTITDSTIYTWGADLEITNSSGSDQSFTLTVSGRPYRQIGGKRITVENTENIRKNGAKELIIDNPLVQTTEQAQAIANALINSFSNVRNQTRLDAIPDPRIELGDTIGTGDNNYFGVIRSDLQLKPDQLLHGIEARR